MMGYPFTIIAFLNGLLWRVLLTFRLHLCFRFSCKALPDSPGQWPPRDGLAPELSPILPATAYAGARPGHICPGRRTAPRQIVQGRRHMGMVWPQGFLRYCQRPLVQGLGLGL